MKDNEINALSAAVISFVAVIGLIVGFYYSLKTSGNSIFYILVFEALLIGIILLFTLWVKEEMRNGY